MPARFAVRELSEQLASIRHRDTVIEPAKEALRKAEETQRDIERVQRGLDLLQPQQQAARRKRNTLAYDRRKPGLAQLVKEFDSLQHKAPAQDMISYLERTRLFGEEAALEWLKQKYGER